MIRKAVGAIVIKGNKFLIVAKVKEMSTPDGPTDIPMQWHIPGGGIRESDESNRKALERELLEETGSDQYTIIKEYEDKICFDFPDSIRERTGFTGQVTTMFLVEYTGLDNRLIPIDEEIDRVEFVSMGQLLERVFVIETKEFIERNLNSFSLGKSRILVFQRFFDYHELKLCFSKEITKPNSFAIWISYAR